MWHGTHRATHRTALAPCGRATAKAEPEAADPGEVGRLTSAWGEHWSTSLRAPRRGGDEARTMIIKESEWLERMADAGG
jgi:hypothetical protein